MHAQQPQNIQLNSFKRDGNKCNENANDNIIDECDSLKRLVFGLMYQRDYKNSDKLWNEFCLNVYGHKMLDDYHHLLFKHQNKLDQIKNELIKKYGLSDCQMQQCQFSLRHFSQNRSRNVKEEKKDEKNDELIALYDQEYDSLHFNLFHLFDIGYRFKKQQNNEKDNDVRDKYTKCVDNELSDMVKTMIYNRNKYKNTFERFKNEKDSNKYNINSTYGVENKMNDANDDDKTFIDKIFEYFQANGTK
eukprot:67035_1